MTLSTRALRIATLAYLAIPMIIFAFGWLRWPLAVAIVAAIAWFFIAIARSGDHGDRRIAISWRELAGLAIVCVLWAVLSGIGGFGYQTYDYDKHNAVMKTLIDSRWPVELLGTHREPSMLVYYVGYYMVPAAAGKLVGWHVAALVTAIWSAIGIALALAWVGVIARSMQTRTLVVFVLWGGLALVGAATFRGISGPFETWNVEAWSNLFAYPCNTSHLYWAPQHALAGWLTAAIVIHEDATEGALLTGPWLVAFALLWSPFVALGLVPLLASSAVRVLRARGLRVIPWPLWIPPIGIGLVMLALFAARREPLPHGWAPSVFGWSFAKLYVPFCVLEFGIYAALLAERPPLMRVAIGCLLVIPFYKYGYYDDFVIRTSLPSTFLLSVAVAGELSRGRMRLLVPWLVGTTAAITAIYVSLLYGPRIFTLAIPEQPTAIMNLRPHAVAVQYLGRPDAFFFTTLAR